MINQRVSSYRLVLSALAISLATAGCGGGGDGTDSSSSSNSSSSTGGSLSGVASKGLLKGADVNVYCGNASGTKLWTGLTDSAGNYKASWTAACSQPVLVVVSANSSTKMTDEMSGQDVAAPAGLKLRAFVSDATNTTSRSITPFTEMAAALALSIGSIPTAAQVASAQAAIVNTVLNGQQGVFDATPVMPQTASSDANVQKLSVLLSAFAQQANARGDIQQFMDSLNTQIQKEISIAADGTITSDPSKGVSGDDPVAVLTSGLNAIKTTPPVGATAIIAALANDTTLTGNRCVTSSCTATAGSGGATPTQAAAQLLNSLRANLTLDMSTFGRTNNTAGFIENTAELSLTVCGV